VEITFDLAKNERNIGERGLSFERAVETGIRVISFRKANAREARQYGEAKAIDR